MRHRCRICRSDLSHVVIDLGVIPLCESFLSASQLNELEPSYPLVVYVCEHCFLVQIPEYVNPHHIFTEYAYYSSFSDTWLNHAKGYSEMIVRRFSMTSQHQVVEIASNDGYLLQYFLTKGMPVLGVEPALNVARVAMEKGIPCVTKFFNRKTAKELVADGVQADLLVANNVLSQVPDLHDFVEGLKILLKPTGVITIEVPHLLDLLQKKQFDTIYHEHYSYFSLITLDNLFTCHDLIVFDVEELSTHGGSLRIYVRHRADHSKPISPQVVHIKEKEQGAGLTRLAGYCSFDVRVQELKEKLVRCLRKIRAEGKSIVGYGAPGKGNTLLNFCGIKSDLVEFTVDRNPYKHGKYTPGTHIPIYPVERIRDARPHYILVLPWNVKDEIIEQMGFVQEWGGAFIVPIPDATIVHASERKKVA